jgi:hypothetical protein
MKKLLVLAALLVVPAGQFAEAGQEVGRSRGSNSGAQRTEIEQSIQTVELDILAIVDDLGLTNRQRGDVLTSIWGQLHDRTQQALRASVSDKFAHPTPELAMESYQASLTPLLESLGINSDTQERLQQLYSRQLELELEQIASRGLSR